MTSVGTPSDEDRVLLAFVRSEMGREMALPAVTPSTEGWREGVLRIGQACGELVSATLSDSAVSREIARRRALRLTTMLWKSCLRLYGGGDETSGTPDDADRQLLVRVMQEVHMHSAVFPWFEVSCREGLTAILETVGRMARQANSDGGPEEQRLTALAALAACWHWLLAFCFRGDSFHS